MSNTKTPWMWWAGRDEEWMSLGPFTTREEAVEEGQAYFDGDGFHIIEAQQAPLRLADWIGADRLLEMAEEQLADSDRISPEDDTGPWFSCTPEQEKDLIARITAACDEWQKAHGLVFSCLSFSAVRNEETIPMTDEAYLAAIDREAVRRGYMPEGDSLVGATGPEVWLEAWRDDPSLTPQEQVSEEIMAAQEVSS